MENEQFEALKEKYDFASWKGINQLDRDLSVRRLSLPDGLLPGLDAERIRKIDPNDGTRLLRASWSLHGEENVLLSLDIRECKSRIGAHEVLIELLANMQAPDVAQVTDDPPGDIAFARKPLTAIIFARANIAVSLRNGGEKLVPVDTIAKEIDQWLLKQSN